MYDELADEAWYVRRSVPLMRRFRRASPRQRAASVCGALGALLLVATVGAMLAGPILFEETESATPAD